MSNENKAEKKPDINLKLKVYPFIGEYENRKGNFIGNIKSTMNINNLPYSYFDQVDHMMYNLFGYVRDRNNPNKYFNNNHTDGKDTKGYEIRYNSPETSKKGGKKRKTIKKTKKMKKSKTNKTKTYKR